MRKPLFVFSFSVSLLCLSPIPANAQPGARGPDDHDEGMAHLFARFDADRDGLVSEAEFLATANGFFDQLSALSGDTDRKISFEEFREALPRIVGDEGMSDGGPPDPSQLFDRVDRNGDGVVHPQEMPRADLEGALSDWLAKQGRSGEGLNREEFVAFFQHVMSQADRGGNERHNFDPNRTFDHLDRNEDQRVVASEVGDPQLRAAMTRWQAERGHADEGLGREEFIAFLSSSFGPGPGGRHDPGPDRAPSRQDTSDENVRGRAFDQADSNNDGVLTLEEIAPHEREHFKFQLRLFQRGEDDGVSREEFIKGPSLHPRDLPNQPPDLPSEPPPPPGVTPLSLE